MGKGREREEGEERDGDHRPAKWAEAEAFIS